MSPADLIRSAILESVASCVMEDEDSDGPGIKGPFDTVEKINDAIVALEENGHDDYYSDMEYEFRSGDVETGLDIESGRHFETKGVAALINGQWVGWTYYYGGGKYAEPSQIEWIDDAYFLDVKEETKVVRVFTKQETIQGAD